MNPVVSEVWHEDFSVKVGGYATWTAEFVLVVASGTKLVEELSLTREYLYTSVYVSCL